MGKLNGHVTVTLKVSGRLMKCPTRDPMRRTVRYSPIYRKLLEMLFRNNRFATACMPLRLSKIYPRLQSL